MDKNNHNGQPQDHSNDHNNDHNINPEAEEAQVMDNVPEAADESSEAVEAQELDEITKLAAELGETKGKLEKEKKEYMFLMAEFDNFRKRSLKEKSDLIKNAAESALKGILPIVDDFERGLEAAKGSGENSQAILDGMVLIYNKLVKYLNQNGVKAMETTGQPFDPEQHEAIAMVPVTDEEQKGKVIDTLTKGYMLNDKVLRHAKVAVGQ